MGKSGVLKSLIIVFAILDAVVLIGGGTYLLLASKSLKGLSLQPDFTEQELSVNQQYTFTVKGTPDSASLKKVECSCDDMSATFELSKSGEKATLITGGSEGTVTVYVEYKDIKSEVLTFQVVDMAARAAKQAEEEAAAQAAAEAEAAAAAEAEAQAAAKVYVMMTGDNVNVRAQNNTDCDILGKAKKGESFEKVENVDEWTHILYNGQDGYVKTEFLKEVSEEEALSAPAPDTTENKTEEKKEEKKEEDQKPEQSEEEKQKAAEAAAAEAAQKAAEELAAQAQAAAAAAAAAGPTLECADGLQTFTSEQYNFLKGFWWREGQTSDDDWKAYAHKHTKAECLQICEIEGGIH